MHDSRMKQLALIIVLALAPLSGGELNGRAHIGFWGGGAEVLAFIAQLF